MKEMGESTCIKEKVDKEASLGKKEVAGDDNKDGTASGSPAVQTSAGGSMFLSFPVEDCSFYCEICKQKYEAACPKHGPHIYLDNMEDSRRRHGGTRNMRTKFNLNIMDRKMSKRDIMKQTLICGEDGETLSCQYCCLLFPSPEDLHEHEKTMHGDKFLESYKHEELLDGINKDKGGNSNQLVMKKGNSSITETTSTESNITETINSLDCHEKVINISEPQSNCEVNFSENLDTESNKVFSMFGNSSLIPDAEMAKMLQDNEDVFRSKNLLRDVKFYKCDICPAAFYQMCHLSRHYKIHTGERSYKCDICGVGFSQSGHLSRHILTHTGEKPYKCEICGAAFTRDRSLLIHTRLHTGEKPYKCDICGVSFAEYSNLVSHTRTHTGEKPYKCDICGSAFSQTSSLKTHRKVHTGEKPYKCDVCGCAFSQCSHLSRHKRIHTGAKPYKCDICSLEFADVGNLNRHKRRHTGEKSYKCEVCKTAFAQHWHLKRHRKTHEVEKPYKCDICNEWFPKIRNLQAHVRKHTEGKIPS